MKPWQMDATKALMGIKATPDFKMAEITTFKIGGPADLLVEPMDLEQLGQVMNFCKEKDLPWMVVGLGSNLLVRDKGIRGVVVMLQGAFKEWQINGTTVTAGAGMPLGDLSRETAAQGLSGLEFACGIPGTVGGAAYMNAGAYNGEISQVLARAQVFDIENGAHWYERADFHFGYRKSRFQTDPGVIVKLVFELVSRDAASAMAKVAELTCRREAKQPLDQPSAGSVFRRPEGYYVGPLIEKAGLKGFAIGGAQVSPKHAGFIINKGGATAQDVLNLIDHIQNKVKEQFGVELVPEIRVVGEE